MKYLLLTLVKSIELIIVLMLVTYLIIERTVKVCMSLLVFMWDFKFDANKHKFHKSFDIFIPVVFFVYHCKYNQINDYFYLRNGQLDILSSLKETRFYFQT